MTVRNLRVDPSEDRDDPIEEDQPAYVPLIYRWGMIAHYYGDTVRLLFMLAAVVLLTMAPFYTDDMTTEMPFIVVGIFVMVAVAALTTPSQRTVISADAIVAGVGLVIFEMWALLGYSESTVAQFVLRELLALIFLVAFYYSTKTLRAMFLHQIGVRDSRSDRLNDKLHGKDLDEFLEESEIQSLSKQELYEYNQHIKHEYDD